MNPKNASLEQLENQIWPAPDNPTSLILRCHTLRKKALSDLKVEDVRLLIGQNIGLAYLVPLALDMVEENPWVSGDYYDGDLLENLLRIKADFWLNHKDLYTRLTTVMERLITQMHTCQKELLPKWAEIEYL